MSLLPPSPHSVESHHDHEASPRDTLVGNSPSPSTCPSAADNCEGSYSLSITTIHSSDAEPNSPAMVQTAGSPIKCPSDAASPPSPQTPISRTFFMPARVETGDTLQGPLSLEQTREALSQSSTVKPSVTMSPTLKKTATYQVTPITSTASAQPSKFSLVRVYTVVKEAYNAYWMQGSMIGLAILGLLSAMAHHLYNSSLDGRQVKGDPQWPPRYGSALSFFVKATLIASVQVAYKQQAWLAVKKRALKVSTLDAIFSVYYDPLQFTELEFLLKTWLPALLAVISWALPLCAIASPSTLTSTSGFETIATNCSSIPTVNLTREIGYTLDEDQDDLSGLANWNIRADSEYIYDQPSPELQRLFQLSVLSTTGPIAPDNPCPAGTNCTYTTSFFAPAYGCEDRDEFGGPGQQVSKSDMAPEGALLYASYSSLPMGPEDDNGAPLIWTNMSDANPNDPDIGVFTALPSLWLGWTTGAPTATNLWGNLTAHITECQMYNATYTFNVTFANGQMNITDSETQLNNLLLPEGSTESPNATDYLEFGSYHATGWLLRNLLSGNVTLANVSDPTTEYAITWTELTQTTLLNTSTQLPTGGDDLTASVGALYRSVFFSMMSDTDLHDRQLSTLACTITTAGQVWKYEPFWLILPYSIAVGITLLTLLVGMHGFIANGYAADTNFSTFVTTSRSKDLDELSRGACLGHWPKEKHLIESRLQFGEIETDGPTPHAAFAFPQSVKGYDKKKQYIQRAGTFQSSKVAS